ncbi:MAG: hypothetical protein ACKVQK_11420 [Burkholderiales bacterium]
MNIATKILNVIAFAAACLACTGAIAQNWPTPKKLTGKWTLAGSNDGHRIVVAMDTTTGTGQVSVTFPEDRCSIRSAPMTMNNQGGRILLKSFSGYASMCVTEMTLEMVPSPGPKGAIGYRGELRLVGSAANRAPILRGQLTEP